MIELDLIHFFNRLKKQAGKFNRIITPYEIKKKCRKDTIVLDGDECVKIGLDFCLNLKGGERRD